VYKSDIIAFFIILIGFFVSFLHLVSKAFNIPIPEHLESENPDEVSATLKSMRYRLIAKSSGDLEYSIIDPKLEEK
jgi:hypothetical protein